MSSNDQYENAKGVWPIALQDAGYGDDDVDLVLIDTQDQDFTLTQYQPAGRPLPTLPADVEPPEFRLDRARVVQRLNTGAPEIKAAALTLMRSSLEYHRFHEESRATYALNLQIGDALAPLLGGKGLVGGAVVWNALPMIRSANAAGALLAFKTLGPALGHFHDRELGHMLRLDYEPLDPADRALATVVFAAIWHEEMQAFATTALADSARDIVADVDPHAGAWWDALMADETFVSLRTAARIYLPSAEEVAPIERPETAWRPLEGLLDRALAYGTAIAEGTPSS